jgi:2-amino-4-hydroxy-6-hydroxymethyldihydropteridine diphosphokinase
VTAPALAGTLAEPIVIGLGGNLGDAAAIIERFDRARFALAALASDRITSARLYRSAPIGPDQPWFLNTALRIALPDAQPAELLATLLEIERLLGRRRAEEARWGPRPIDLDLLVWGSRVIRTPELDVPHPRLAERRFALLPLIDLLGDSYLIPGHGTAGDLVGRVAEQACDAIAATW